MSIAAVLGSRSAGIARALMRLKSLWFQVPTQLWAVLQQPARPLPFIASQTILWGISQRAAYLHDLFDLLQLLGRGALEQHCTAQSVGAALEGHQRPARTASPVCTACFAHAGSAGQAGLILQARCGCLIMP